MFGIRPFLFGLLMGAGGGLFAANYHVVNTSQGVVVVPRTQRPPLRSSYVDIRSWSEAMWVNHPEVTQALIADGRSSLIGDNLKENLLDEILPQQTQDNRPPRSRTIARRTEVPISIETAPSNPRRVGEKSSPPMTETARLLDSKSAVRQRWESALDQAIAPIVDDDPATLASDELASEPSREVLPENGDHAAIVRKLEDRFGGLLDTATPTNPREKSSQLEALPTSGNASEMARDLLKQVIPHSGKLPGSAAPLRNLGRELLSAPAPGQGGAAQLPSRVPVQSQLIPSKPF